VAWVRFELDAVVFDASSRRKARETKTARSREAFPNRTLEQHQSKTHKAVRFLRDVLGDDERAEEVEDENPEDYADRKGTHSPKRRTTNVANGNGDTMSKSELQDCIDAAVSILEAAYVPEADRETLAAAVGDALAALNGDYNEAADDDSDDDDQSR
jgi:hypothetical protein